MNPKKYRVLQRHPLSEGLPGMNKAEFGALRASVRKHGFFPSHPIILFKGRVADGWHRLQAATAEDVEPIFAEWKGDEEELRDYVVVANIVRRHLPRHQAAMLLDKKGYGALPPTEAAKKAGVPPEVVRQARRLEKKDPGLAAKVRAGTLAYKTAARQIHGEPRLLKYTHTFSAARTRRIEERIAGTGLTKVACVNAALDDYLAARQEAS